MTKNQLFLTAIDAKTKNQILSNIANHYGISTQDAYEEIVDDNAEHLLEYMVEPQRSATSVIMQKHGCR